MTCSLETTGPRRLTARQKRTTGEAVTVHYHVALLLAALSAKPPAISAHSRVPRGSSSHEETAAAVPGESCVKGQGKVSAAHTH